MGRESHASQGKSSQAVKCPKYLGRSVFPKFCTGTVSFFKFDVKSHGPVMLLAAEKIKKIPKIVVIC